MSDRKQFRLTWLVAFCVVWPSLGRGQATTQPSDENNASQIRQLRSEVQDLRAQVNSQSSSPATGAKQNDSLGIHAGWDPNKGFIIRSQDDAFLLHPWAFIQVRDATNYRSDQTGPGGADTENGFELPRMKLILDGNIFTRDLTYQFIWATDDTSGSLLLQDAWARYHFQSTPFAIEGGQIRNPVDHEQLLYATKSLTPDRSIINNVLLNGDDIVKGVELSCGYDSDSTLRGLVAFTSGQRNFDTTFQDYPVNSANWGTAGRIEWKLCGNWEDYKQFTALGDRAPLLVAGGGFDYSEAGAAAPLTHVADIQCDLPEGTSIFAAYLGRYTRDNAGPPASNGQFTTASTARADTYDSTARFMIAQVFDQRFEPFFRYEFIHFDTREVPAGLGSTVNDLTLGCNYYLYGHRAKFTAAASWLPDGSPVANTIGDLLTSHRGNELIAQVQFQLML